VTALALRTVSDRNAGAPFVARPVADRVAAHARANECARMLDLGELELIRESMCSTFRSGDVVLRVGHFTSSPSGAAELADMLRGHEIAVPQVIATFECDDAGLGVIAYEHISESTHGIAWFDVGEMVRRLHTNVTIESVPHGYPIASPVELPWWNFPEMMSRIEAAGIIDADALLMLRSVADAGERWIDIVSTAPLVIAHGDVHPGNVIMGSDGPVLIDWDLLSVGSSIWDHVPLRARSTPPWQGSEQAYTEFAAGYGDVEWNIDDLDVLVRLRNLAATILKLMTTTTDGVMTNEAERRIKYWLSSEAVVPWTWG